MNWFTRMMKTSMPLPQAKNYPQADDESSGLTGVRHNLTPEKAKELAGRYRDLQYLGAGQAGVAYTHTDPNTVVKLTRDGLEAERAKELIGQNIRCCVRVLKVEEVNNGVWLMETEKVNALSPKERNIFSRIPAYLEMDARSRKAFNRGVASYVFDDYVREYQQLVQCLRAAGINDEDAEGDNLGRRADGSLVLLDVG